MQKQVQPNGPQVGESKHQRLMSVLDKISHPVNNDLPSTLEVPTSQMMSKL